ncbi:hypothetical protein B0I21_11338 [Sphingobacterium paludis]|uniref:Uncharacterized protein n=1 Tax=Sphingobacterium paludis TaxID=1476465 RepID=A0A4R7CUP6_9SPHI|nr:hypothetical protein B0I21_11338 [Sphingobacterium paludis]
MDSLIDKIPRKIYEVRCVFPAQNTILAKTKMPYTYVLLLYINVSIHFF